MTKILEFLKSKKLVIQWTIGYFVFMFIILRFLFNFDIFSAYHWHKFFNIGFRGFNGFVLFITIYAIIPIYIATTVVINRTNTSLVKIPFLDKISDISSKIFPKKEPEPEPEAEPIEPEIQNPNNDIEMPSDLPPELRVPFMRVKQHMKIHTNISVYNKTPTSETVVTQTTTESFSKMLPNDFEIPDDNTESVPEFGNDFIPTFTDVNFDEPKTEKFENNTTKYFDEKHTEYEVYKNFVATEKFVIYEHNDDDFWIMDEEDWFASGKQIDSPIKELIDLAKQNGLTPVLYLQSQNIMDIENTIKTFENMGVRVIKNLDELN